MLHIQPIISFFLCPIRQWLSILACSLTGTDDRSLSKVMWTDNRGGTGCFMRPLVKFSMSSLHMFWHIEGQVMNVIDDKWKTWIPVWIWGPQLFTDWIRSRYDSYSLCFIFVVTGLQLLTIFNLHYLIYCLQPQGRMFYKVSNIMMTYPIFFVL